MLKFCPHKSIGKVESVFHFFGVTGPESDDNWDRPQELLVKGREETKDIQPDQLDH